MKQTHLSEEKKRMRKEKGEKVRMETSPIAKLKRKSVNVIRVHMTHTRVDGLVLRSIIGNNRFSPENCAKSVPRIVLVLCQKK